MNANPECTNCFEAIRWTPVYQDGEPFCCDGCVMGGPCVCTYDGPAPKLNTREILISAGYDPVDWVDDLNVCANCFDEFKRSPILGMDGASYCCVGCRYGGPCTCTYATPDVAPAEVHIQEEEAPPSESEVADEIHTRFNGLWASASISPVVDANAPSRANRLWYQSDNPSAPQPVPDVKATNPWSDFTEFDLDAYDEKVKELEICRVTVAPLADVTDVRDFTKQMENIPSIQAVMLTHYGGASAEYEVQVEGIQQVIKDLISVETLPIRNFNLTPGGLEIVLKSKTNGIMASAPIDGILPNGLPISQMTTSRKNAVHMEDSDELHAFNYEIGVDVFFNGRHQVAIQGVKGPIHMHSWRVQAILQGSSVNEEGSVVGSQDVKDIITELVTGYNETLLNKVPPFDDIMPTSNNIARVIHEHVTWQLQGKDARLKSIRLWEAPTSYVEYSGDGATTL